MCASMCHIGYGHECAAPPSLQPWSDSSLSTPCARRLTWIERRDGKQVARQQRTHLPSRPRVFSAQLTSHSLALPRVALASPSSSTPSFPASLQTALCARGLRVSCLRGALLPSPLRTSRPTLRHPPGPPPPRRIHLLIPRRYLRTPSLGGCRVGFLHAATTTALTAATPSAASAASAATGAAGPAASTTSTTTSITGAAPGIDRRSRQGGPCLSPSCGRRRSGRCDRRGLCRHGPAALSPERCTCLTAVAPPAFSACGERGCACKCGGDTGRCDPDAADSFRTIDTSNAAATASSSTAAATASAGTRWFPIAAMCPAAPPTAPVLGGAVTAWDGCRNWCDSAKRQQRVYRGRCYAAAGSTGAAAAPAGWRTYALEFGV